MAQRQIAVKHDFVCKIAGGCSFYDVIASWPDLTWSTFLPKVAQGLPHHVSQNPAARNAAVFPLSAKKAGGGGVAPTPTPLARVNGILVIHTVFLLLSPPTDIFTPSTGALLLLLRATASVREPTSPLVSPAGAPARRSDGTGNRSRALPIHGLRYCRLSQAGHSVGSVWYFYGIFT